MRPGNVVAARFAVWAPNAQAVSLIWGNTVSGYVANDGTGQDAAKPAIVLQKTTPNGANWNGIWETDPAEAALQDFNALVAQPYMYRLKREGEADALMRTDIYSRSQLGTGDARPPTDPVPALWRDLDGIVACSVVCDPDVVTANVADLAFPPANTIGSADFWAGEFDANNPVPTRLPDMSIYILHVGGLGFGGPPGSPGTLKDAINHLDHVVNLGMNTICLMPISQYEGRASWGYGNSHFYAPDFAAGGRDLLKHFIKECHKKGIAVMLDVVYNHFANDTDRAEWEYDSPASEKKYLFRIHRRAGRLSEPGKWLCK
jgi:1,4-alpha-glucan branching enzyme